MRQNLGLLTDVDFLDEVRLSLIASRLELTAYIAPTVRQHFHHRDGVPRHPGRRLRRFGQSFG